MNILRKIRNQRGFTLLEMLVVITIIGSLATIVTPNLLKHLRNTEIASTTMSLNGIINALEMYRYNTGSYPTTTEGLEALYIEPNGITGWDGPYITKPVYPKDAWSVGFDYLSPGAVNTTIYDLWSYGPDETDATIDDITNWE